MVRTPMCGSLIADSMTGGSHRGHEGDDPMSTAWRTGRYATFAAGSIAIATLALGCGGAGATKAGKTTAPVVLRMANASADLGYEPAVAYFVRRVRALSGGALRIHVVNEWGHYKPTVEEQIVRDVAADRADLAWVGTRTFDTLGVQSFEALTAPMLIDSYALERAVIGSKIPRRMLESLPRLRVTGLAVLADGLRKPIAVKRPLFGPADWRGITFATFRSHGQADAIRALGARSVVAFNATLFTGLDKGTIQGFEKSLHIYDLNNLERVAPYITANVNLWPQTVALIASPARLSTLTAAQRGWLWQAAVDAAARSTSLVDRDAEAAAAGCKYGARLADASSADLAALRRAFAGVYDRLERNPRTKAFIARIRRLKASTTAERPLAIPRGCAARTTSTTSTTVASSAKAASSALDGAYRVRWTARELLAAGTSSHYAKGNAGIVTMTMRHGQFTWRALPPPDCAGTYAVSGNTVSIKFTVYCHGRVDATWSLQNDRLGLRVRRATDPGDEILFGRKPWAKIG
jgi:TRAP-type transport system periplasmic protein